MTRKKESSPGDRVGPVTVRDLAGACGLHFTTVSYALHGDRRRVSAATVERVQALAREMGYEPGANEAARRLSLQRGGIRPLRRIVGIVTDREVVAEPYYFRIFQGMLRVLTAEGFGIFISYREDDSPEGLHPALLRGDVDALLLPGSFGVTPEEAGRLRRLSASRTFPIVSVIFSQPGWAAVVADDAGGAQALVAYVLDQGHRELLHHADESSSVHVHRLEGYRRACRERGLDPEQVLHFNSWWRPYGRDRRARDWVWEALCEAREAYPETTAILAPNDLAAVQYYEALAMNGIRVPEDLSLTGFDDTHVIPEGKGGNLLTTVHVPLEEIGQEAARLILRQLAGEALPGAQIVLPTHLVPRGSVASPS